jgi:transketolase C-terminal domain/subunit
VTSLPHSGKAEQLLAKYNIDAAGIAKKVKSLV